MARIWKDRAVEHPRRYRDQNGNTLILTPDPGEILEVGTPVNAANMNAIESSIQAVEEGVLESKELLPLTARKAFFSNRIESITSYETNVNRTFAFIHEGRYYFIIYGNRASSRQFDIVDATDPNNITLVYAGSLPISSSSLGGAGGFAKVGDYLYYCYSTMQGGNFTLKIARCDIAGSSWTTVREYTLLAGATQESTYLVGVVTDGTKLYIAVPTTGANNRTYYISYDIQNNVVSKFRADANTYSWRASFLTYLKRSNTLSYFVNSSYTSGRNHITLPDGIESSGFSAELTNILTLTAGNPSTLWIDSSADTLRECLISLDPTDDFAIVGYFAGDTMATGYGEIGFLADLNSNKVYAYPRLHRFLRSVHTAPRFNPLNNCIYEYSANAKQFFIQPIEI